MKKLSLASLAVSMSFALSFSTGAFASTETEVAKLLASDGAAPNGRSVAIDGDTAVIGGSGTAYVFTRSGSTWTEQAKLQKGGGLWSVAIDGDTIVGGSQNSSESAESSGVAYIFTRSGSTWTEQATLLGSDVAAFDSFGSSVAIDGDTVVIGASSATGAGAGSAYIFTRSGNTWSEQAKLLASDGHAGARFGWSAAIGGDTVVVGADADNATGSAYIFTRSGSTWAEQTKLLASDAAADDFFGGSVAIYGDTVVIGSTQEARFLNLGSAYIFTRTGNIWTEQARLLASDAADNDQFGRSVAMDIDTVVIGANGDDGNSGSAYIFTRNGGTWTEQAKLLASDGPDFAQFGWSVAIDGGTVLIGSRESYGSAYIFGAPPPYVVPSPGLSGPWECSDTSGTTISAVAVRLDDPNDPFTTLEWFLDGNTVGTALVGDPLPIDVPLGDHLLKVIGTTALGATDEDEIMVTVEDTTGPVIQASLLAGGKKNQAEVSITATDVCDTNPMFTATAGIEVMDGQLLKIDKKSNELELGSDGLSLTIVATDASGNTTEEQVQLQQ